MLLGLGTVLTGVGICYAKLSGGAEAHQNVARAKNRGRSNPDHDNSLKITTWRVGTHYPYSRGISYAFS